MAKRQAFFDDLMEFGSRLPWRVAVLSAVGAFVGLHVVAVQTSSPVTGTTLADLGGVAQPSLIHVFAAILQYVVPAGLLIGAIAGFVKQSQAKSLVSSARANPKTISEMSWREFERLVGEAFRQRGFTVTGFGGGGPDGGVDLALVKNGERFLVQCKHWRTQQVGVTVVRELNGLIAAMGAHGGYVVTGGQFTREAGEFAQQTKVELINGHALEELIDSVRSSSPVSDIKVGSQSAPSCPRCGTAMVQRVAKQGKHAGRSFWGCRGYPKCTAIVQIS
jgi:restriction system protein